MHIETPAGKQEHAAAQRAFAECGAPLRARLVEECETLLGAVRGIGGPPGAEVSTGVRR